MDSALRDPLWRAAYLSALHNLVFNVTANGYFETRIDEIYKRIRPDAILDDAKWHAGDIDKGRRALLAQIKTRRAQLVAFFEKEAAASKDGAGAAAAVAALPPPARPTAPSASAPSRGP